MSSRRKTITISFLVLFLLFAAALFWGGGGFLSDRTEAGVQDNIHGWAWSSNIGWVSFNCTDTNSCGGVDYGVAIDENTGVLSGYAWSSNIGWVSFNESDLSGCPSGTCKAQLTGSNLIGWAKVLSGGTPEAGGWDGWISLGGPNYGVFLDGIAFKGFGWGSQVVGWVDFAPQFGGVFWSSQIPSVSLSADPLTLPSLSWETLNVDTCSGFFGTPDWPSPKSLSGLEVVGPITQTTIYTLSCSGPFGAASDDVTVAVVGEGFPPAVFLDADPLTIAEGESSELRWSSVNADRCDGIRFSTGGATVGMVTVAPLSTTNYVVVCLNEFGAVLAEVTVTVSGVGTLTPEFEEF